LPLGFAAYYKINSNKPEIQGGTEGEQKQKNNTTQHQHTQRERREGHKA
jgi:hypothetical protein